MRRTARDSGYSTGVSASGFYYAEVVEVNGDRLSIKIPKLMLEHIFTDVPFTGFTPAPGDLIWATFIEGNTGSPVAIAGPNDVDSDITEIVAGTNLNGGGTSGVVTVNLNDNVSLDGTLVVYGTSTFNASASIDGDLSVTGTIDAPHINSEMDGPIVVPVKNTSGSTILKGSAVYATGAVGDSGALTIAPSLASTSASATMPAIAITQTTLTHNGQGHAVLLGNIDGLDTSTWSLNQVLYVSPTVAGGLTPIKPSTSEQHLIQPIGRVSRVNGSTGEIFVNGTGATNDVPNSFSIVGGASIGGNLTLGSSSIIFNNNLAAAAAPSANAGLQVNRGSSTNASFYWDENSDVWSTGGAPVSASVFQGTAFAGVSAGLTGTLSAGYLSAGSAGVTGTLSAGYLSAGSAGVTGTLSAGYLSAGSAGVSGTLSAGYLSAGSAGVSGTLSAGYLSAGSAGVSGAVSAGNLTLTDGTYDLTATESTGNWSLLNKQNDNGIIFYGPAVSGVALRANSATVLQATSASLLLNQNTSVSGSVSITGITRITSSGQVAVGALSHAFEIGTGTASGYGVMMSPSAIQTKNGTSVAPLEINKSGGAVRANGYPVAPLYSVEGAISGTLPSITADSPGFKCMAGRKTVSFSNAYGTLTFPSAFPTNVLCVIVTPEFNDMVVTHAPTVSPSSNASQVVLRASQAANNSNTVYPSAYADFRVGGGNANGPFVVNYIAFGY